MMQMFKRFVLIILINGTKLHPEPVKIFRHGTVSRMLMKLSRKAKQNFAKWQNYDSCLQYRTDRVMGIRD